MAKGKGIRKQISELAATGRVLEQQVESLLDQKKYGQARRKLQQALQRDPKQTLKISEADIWLQQGQDEFHQGRYDQAADSLSQAFTQAQTQDTCYWLAKCFLAQQKLAEALALFQSAFEAKSLPKDLGGAYLKLLFLAEQGERVEALIHQQSKRFYAPQLHWARGVLALKANDLETALVHFKKMGRPASPGDHMLSWQAYVQQQLGNWPIAENWLGMSSPRFFDRRFSRPRNQHPAVQRLIMAQVVYTQQSIADFVDLRLPDLSNAATASVLELLHRIDEGNFHDAAHLVLAMPPEVMAAYPELDRLHRPLMLLGGDQALRQQELSCTVAFWGEIVDQPELDPKLAMQLYPVMKQAGEYREAQKLVSQLIRWVQQAAKRSPQTWPESRLQSTLAKLHCWMADSQMVMGQRREAQLSLREAEKLAPEHPDVIGRKGLESLLQENRETAIAQLTQALEAGCRYPEVYIALVEELEPDPDAQKTVRRKYGKHFDDTTVDTEVDIPIWVEALVGHNYALLEQLVEEQQQPSAPVQALQIFLDAAADAPSSSQKITLNQDKAVPQWEQLLQSVSPEAQVDILTAIYLVIQKYAKRNKKGITALQSRYDQAIFALIPETPQAALAHLMLLPLKKLPPERLEMAVKAALNRSTQPGNLLAQAQLHLRRFSTELGFRPFIDQQLQEEPHNPRLLLAKATLFPRQSSQYQTFYDQGFDIARRLQDAAALQAYREEDWLRAHETTSRVIGDQIRILGDPSQIDMIDLLQRLARETLGMDVPPEVLAQMLPELAAQMGVEDFEEGDEDDLDRFFFPPPPPGKGRKSSNRRQSFYDL